MNLVDEALQDERCWTVYVHINKINNKGYVGITSRKPEERWRSGKGYNGQPFWNAIQKYGWDNFDHEIIASNLTCDEANEFEITLIKELNTLIKNGNGYNTTEGGKGGRGNNTDRSKFTMENATNVSKVICLNTMEVYGCIKDAVQKTKARKISECCRGEQKSSGRDSNGNKLLWTYYDDTKDDEYYKQLYIEKSSTSVQHKEIGGSHHNARKIINMKTGEIYDSISMLGSMAKSVRYKLKTKDLEWMYYDEYLEWEATGRPDRKVEIKQKKTTGKKVFSDGIEFSSVKKFSEYYGLKYNTVKCWLNGNAKLPTEWIGRVEIL